MKKKKSTSAIPFKYDLEELFAVNDRAEFRPEHLFFAYFGDLPSAYSLQRFNKESIQHWLIKNYSTDIAKTIRHEIFYSGGKINDDGIIFIFKNELLIRMEGILTSIYYSERSQVFAQKVVKELLQFEWDKDKIVSLNFLQQNND